MLYRNAMQLARTVEHVSGSFSSVTLEKTSLINVI